MFGYPVATVFTISLISVCHMETINPLLPREIVTKTGQAFTVSFFKAELSDTPTVRELLTPKEFKLASTKWKKTTLTYCVRNSPSSGSLSDSQVNAIIAQAVKYWSDVSCLQFVNDCSSESDLEMSFETGSHGDNSPFDDTGGVLAHAYFPLDDNPIGGDVHFDDGENFSAAGEGTNLLYVATHEIGHSIGIDHSDDDTAIMYPTYRGYVPDLKLGADDIAAVQALYGTCASTTTTSTSTTTTTTTQAPSGGDRNSFRNWWERFYWQYRNRYWRGRF